VIASVAGELRVDGERVPPLSKSRCVNVKGANPDARGLVARGITPLLRIDLDAVGRGVEAMRQRNPGASESELARRIIRDVTWSAGAVSFALALPSHPALAVAATAAELVILRRLETIVIARLAHLYAPGPLQVAGRPNDVLQSLLDGDPAREVAAELWSSVGRQTCRAALEHAAGKHVSRALAKALKRAGVDACGRRLLGKMVPVVGAIGGAIGGARDVRRSAERALARLEAMQHASSPRDVRAVACLVSPPPAPEDRPPVQRPASTARRAALHVAVAAIRAGDALAAAARGLQAAGARSSARRFTVRGNDTSRDGSHPTAAVVSLASRRSARQRTGPVHAERRPGSTIARFDYGCYAASAQRERKR
jgi:hypothetical protein